MITTLRRFASTLTTAAIPAMVLVSAGTVRAQAQTQAKGQRQAQAQSPRAVDPLAPRTKGSARAPITVYEMSDFQCPFCRRFARETFPTLEKEYVESGKVRWVFINFPLTSVHPNAAPAAELAMCAAQQDAFWPVHDLLYQHQEQWAPMKEAEPFLLGLADSAKIDRKKVLACLESPETRSAVQADAEGAARSGAASTPAFYIEGGLLTGAHPVELFRRILDSIYTVKQKRP
jgi:protein-disulfide isomerase